MSWLQTLLLIWPLVYYGREIRRKKTESLSSKNSFSKTKYIYRNLIKYKAKRKKVTVTQSLILASTSLILAF